MTEPKPPTPPRNIFQMLADRHEAPAWAFLDEVRNGTGFGRTVRTADALAMSLFPSRGLHLHGFEVKVSRADWLKELKAPEKAEEIAASCHYWWLVIDDPAIVKNGELPQPWGLLQRKGDKLVVGKQAVFNEHATPPTYRFLGAILRKFAATASARAQIDAAERRGRELGWAGGVEHAVRHSQDGRAQGQLEELQARVKEFEEKSGVSINRYHLGNVAAAVSLLANGYGSTVSQLKQFAARADDIAKSAREALDGLGAMIPKDE